MPAQKPGRSKQDYGTPREFLDAVEGRFGKLTCDLACTRENMKCPEGYTYPEHDSLGASWAKDWPYGNLWLNPPFSNLEDWADKCAVESPKRVGFIFLLTPASVGTTWFDDYVHLHAYVLGLSPRLTFEGATDPYPKDLIMSIYGYGLRGFDTWRWK
jgi:phage N-6-adenine-methyltransferase